MIKLHVKLPHRFNLALSGGPDSMSALDFFCRGHRDFKCIYFNHKTKHSVEAVQHVVKECKNRGVELIISDIDTTLIDKAKSLEAEWRKQRIAFFNSFNEDIITAHNLNDVVEWWMFTSLHGNPRLIPTRNKNILRPFLTTSKDDFLKWNKKNDVKTVLDPGNTNRDFMRTIIRHDMMPHVLKINPGIGKVLRKKIMRIKNEA